ncbi:MAG: hypothetical protein J2P28_01020 [Actinobacteria bacterium]|nr:hypothetical protein [Actinomycetota bacterium]
MNRARHGRFYEAFYRVPRTRGRIIVTAAVAAAALVASSVWLISGSGLTGGHLTASQSAPSPTASPLPPGGGHSGAASQTAPLAKAPSVRGQAKLAEGHSPRLLNDLSGPLSGTGKVRPALAVTMTAALQQTTAAASTMLNGIDVASFQHPVTNAFPNGTPIDWTQVHDAGYQFAAIKATEGLKPTAADPTRTYVNPFYASDAAAATAAGMYVAAYHFANPSDSDGATQAQNALNHFGPYKVGGQFLPLMLDMEYDPYNSTDGLNQCYGLTPSAMVTWISAFVAKAKALTGVAPIIYTPRPWWDACTANSTAFGGQVLWVPARSAGTPGVLPVGWDTWAMWQYGVAASTTTNPQPVPGISADVDLDLFSGGPQAENSALNTPVSIQIHSLNALAGQAVTYTATGLPTGTSISSSGLITGKPTVAGTYQVTVSASPTTVLPAQVSFTWVVTSAAIAVAGDRSGTAWAQAPQLGAGWHRLGGSIAAPPAVVAAPNTNITSPVSPLFIATGTNHLLYMRGVTGSWQRLGPQQMLCYGKPGAVIMGTTLTVACQGSDHSLHYNTATMPSSGLPTFPNAWKSLGGTMTFAPALAPVGGVLTFFVRGNNGLIYTRTLANGWAQTSWSCIATPGAALQPVNAETLFDCQGTNHALYEATNSGYGWSLAVSRGGSLVGAPAAAPTNVLQELVAERSDNAIWTWSAANGWVSLGLTGFTGGVSAAALN